MDVEYTIVACKRLVARLHGICLHPSMVPEMNKSANESGLVCVEGASAS